MRRFAAVLAAAALAVAPGIAAASSAKHTPCGKNKAPHTNCGKHLGHTK